MPKRYVHNDSAEAIFVGGVMIPAGDGREVDASYLAPMEQAEPVAELQEIGGGDNADQNLIELLQANTKTVLATLEGHSDETLAGLLRLEQAAEKPRKGVLEGLAAEQLKRAQARTGAPD